MRPVGAVLEAAQTVIAPGPCQIDASVRDAGLCRKAAVFKEEALRLLEGVGGSGGVADIPGVAERADLAVVSLASQRERISQLRSTLCSMLISPERKLKRSKKRVPDLLANNHN